MTSDHYETPTSGSDDHMDHQHRKKRVGRACDSCRIKKTKCDGVKPCSRCVQDNKVCVFVEKKKQKDKSHPSGYVELLETRLELLSKSLEQLVALSRPHLKFLNKLAGEDDTISINDIVNYLIKENGLMHNLPLEWEKGAEIAASLSIDDDENIENAAKSFAQHKRVPEENRTHRVSETPVSSRSLERASSHDTDLSLNKDEAGDLSPVSGSSITDQLDFKEFSLGGYQTTSLFNDNSLVMSGHVSPMANEIPFSDFESDGRSPNSSQHNAESPNTESRSTPTSTVLYNSLDPIEVIPSGNQLTSLTKHMKPQGIESPEGMEIPNSKRDIATHQSHLFTNSHSKRGFGNHLPMSPTQKLKNGDHIYKLGHHNHNHNHNHLNNHHTHHQQSAKPSSRNRVSAKNLQKDPTFNIDTSASNNFSEFENLMDDFNFVDSLSSDPVNVDVLGIRGLDMYDPARIDNL